MENKQVVVGIDIGGTNTVFGYVDREGNILAEDRIKTNHYDEVEVFIAALYEKIMVISQRINEPVEVIGFGIGAPMGTINKGTIEHPAGLPWKGCLETYVSATGLKRTLLKIMADSIQPSELRKYSFEELDAELIHQAAIRGDPLAIRAFEHTGRMLGFKLADVVAHTNPEAIFLFGGLALAKDLIFEPAKLYMEENLLNIYRDKVKLLPSELSTQNAAVLGASSLIWNLKESSD